MTETKRVRLMEEAVAKMPIPPEFAREMPWECPKCHSAMRVVAKEFHQRRCKG